MQANRNASATADVTPRNSCDYCGAEGGVPPSDLGLQEIDNSTFCSVHAADWRGFHEGCRVMALSNVGAAVVEALEEEVTPAQVAAYVQIALNGGHHRDSVQDVIGGASGALVH